MEGNNDAQSINHSGRFDVGGSGGVRAGIDAEPAFAERIAERAGSGEFVAGRRADRDGDDALGWGHDRDHRDDADAERGGCGDGAEVAGRG